MKLSQVGAIFLVASAAAACKDKSAGTILTPDPVAGLRYVNLVPDTGAVDFRIVDVVGNSPNAVQATFRTGGLINGTSNNGFLPLYTAVAEGTRHIKVFLNGGTPAVSSIVLLDTTYTFTAGANYSFYMYGYAKAANGTPSLQAMITVDTAQTIPNTCPAAATCQYAVRVLHMAPTLAPTLATVAVDVFLDTLAVATTPAGAPTFSNVNLGDVRAYLQRQARLAVGGAVPVPALNYRVAIAATGTTTPFYAVALPAGAAGTSTAQPVPGDLVAGTQITVVLVPRSVAGSAAASFTTPSALFLVDQLPPRTAP